MKENNDFDKLFGSNLPNFADRDWRNLEGQLEQHSLKRKFSRLMWALPVVGGVMMAISGILYYQLNNTREQMRMLENKLLSVYEHEKAEPKISPQKIILHDTIYRQVVIRQVLREIQPNSSNISNNPEYINSAKHEDNITENQFITEREKYIGINKLLTKKVVPSSSNIPIINDLSKYKAIEFPKDSLVEDNHFSLIPKSVSVGFLGGIQKPIGDDFENSGGREIGFRTVLGYNNSKGQERWGVVLDFQQSNLFFDNNKKDHLDKFGSPPNSRQNSGILNKVGIPEFSSYKIGLGLRYNFLFSEKIKPYLGIGWTAQMPSQYKIDFHYIDQSGQYNQSQSVQIDTRKQESINHLLGINTGVNISLSKHLILNSELSFQSQFLNNPNPLGAQTVIGGRVGVNYRFGE